MFCYSIRNKINKKCYIGITSNSLKYRMNQHMHNINIGKYTYFYNAVRKYGFNNFEFSFINDYSGLITYKELQEIEKEEILKYNTFIEGYNMTMGGDGGLTVIPKKICQYDLNANLLKVFDSCMDAFRKTGIKHQHINLCINKGQKSAGGYLWGIFGENMTPYIDNAYDKAKIPVIQYDKTTLVKINTFNSIREAANIVNIEETNISRCCSGKRKSAGGYIWKYA